MLKRKLKTFKLRKAIPVKDSERNSYLDYLEPVEDKAVIWPAGGKIQAEMYGLRLAYMMNMNYYGDLDIEENDAICLSVDDPEYTVKSIKRYDKFIFIELEKLR